MDGSGEGLRGPRGAGDRARPPANPRLGAQAELTVNGPTDRDVELLERAVAGGTEGATDDMRLLQERYRRVEIAPGGVLGGFGRSKGEADLVREVVPFAPDERRAIELAQATLREGKRFEGYLPLGPYLLAGEPVEVTAGVSTLELTY